EFVTPLKLLPSFQLAASDAILSIVRFIVYSGDSVMRGKVQKKAVVEEEEMQRKNYKHRYLG
ncbi:hypothetical protein V2J09_011091, partial [Rumex salicifolius]